MTNQFVMNTVEGQKFLKKLYQLTDICITINCKYLARSKSTNKTDSLTK
jgi:hypothetical protein